MNGNRMHTRMEYSSTILFSWLNLYIIPSIYSIQSLVKMNSIEPFCYSPRALMSRIRRSISCTICCYQAWTLTLPWLLCWWSRQLFRWKRPIMHVNAAHLVILSGGLWIGFLTDVVWRWFGVEACSRKRHSWISHQSLAAGLTTGLQESLLSCTLK